MNSLRLYLIGLITICCLNLSAKEIYVSASGNDQNPGTKAQPMSSLIGARDLIRHLRKVENLKEEVRIIVANGTYLMKEPLILTEEDAGSDNAPVIFIAEVGANPVFVGGIQISNWEKVTDKLWKAKVPDVSSNGLYFEQLYVNGQFAVRAKSPNQGFYFLKDVHETIIDKGTKRYAEKATQKLKIFPKAATDFSRLSKTDFDDAVLTLYHKWDNTRKKISGFEADSSVLITTGEGMKPWNLLDKQTRFTTENYKAALDSCGEWYLERSGTLYYMPREGENITNTKIYAPLTDRFIVFEGNKGNGKKVQNIRFENLRFEIAGYRMPITGNEAAQAASPVEAVIMADYARKIEFVNCGISQIGTNGIWFRKACTDCLVSHCYLHDLGAGGIKIGETAIPANEKDLTQRITVDNNIIRSGGSVFPCAVGITIFQASDNKVTHNEIANFRYSGVSVGWVWGYSYSPSKRNSIEFNHIHHLGWGELSDMGGVYLLGEAQGTTVSNNVIHHIYSFDYGGWGLYTDEGSTGVTMENNLVYACKNSGFHQHYGKENIIHNNIFAANINAELQATRVEPHLSFTFTNNIIWFNSGSLLSSNWQKININSDRNCYWDTRTKDFKFDKQSFKEWQTSGKDKNSVIADPGFVNPQNFDFTIKKLALMKQIGFIPFDYSKAGVYGSAEWSELAKFDKRLAEKYDETVKKLEMQK